jgi:Flp pilus assembly protein TadD
MAKFPLAVRLENAIVAYALYLWKTVWPAKLAVFYPHPGASVSGWSVAASMLVLVAITGIAVGLRSRKYILTGWLWFLGTLVPVIGFVQVGDQAMADRYAYVSLIGVFLMITWAAADFLQARRTPWPLSAAVSIGVLLALSATTHRQIRYWSSDTKLWSHTLAVTTRNSFAHRHVGWALFAANDTADALAQFREAIAINPNDPKNYVNLGLCLEAENQFDAAIEAYKKAVSLTSDAVVLATVYTDLGAAYAQVGKYPEAYESYNRALQLNPLFNAYFNRGLLFEKDGKIEEAIADYQHSAELRPTARAYLQLGRALQELNRSAEAHAAYEKARRLAADPNASP